MHKFKTGIKYWSKRISIIFLCVIPLIISFAQPVSADNTVITAVYESFTSANVGAFRFNGVAAQSGSAIVLTPAAKWQMGTAWWQRKVTLANQRSFSAYFTFTISSPGGTPPIGADGIVFAIQTQSNGAGSSGGGIGYEYITPSVGIEFDTWQNTNYSDINDNHVGVDLGGNMHSVASVSANSVGTFENGSTYYAWVDYNGPANDLQVRLSTTNNRPVNALLTYNGNLAASIGSDVYVGFTSSTGGEWAKHEIDSFYFNNDYLAGGITPATVSYEAGPTTVTASTATLDATRSTISATVRDVLGSTMAGQTVTFTTTRGSLDFSTAVTDGNGVASVILTNATAGTATVRATGVGGAYGETTAEHNVITAVYPSFDSTNVAAFKFNDSATQQGSAIVLTQAQVWQNGSAWWKNKVTLANQRAFSSQFSFKMSGSGGWGSGGADGIVFAIQTQSNGAGSQGSGIGYDGITPSVGIEFDTWQNVDKNDVDANHIAIDLNGNVDSVATTAAGALTTAGITLENGTTYYAWVDYTGSTNTLEVRISNALARPTEPILTYVHDLSSVFGQDVYVGFTGATGNAFSKHEIDSFYFNNNYLTGGITPATVIYEAGPTGVAVTASPSSGTSSTISAVVTDVLGNTMAGQTVTFSKTLGTLDNTTVVTDVSGIAQVALTNSSAGTATIRATGVGGAYGETNVDLMFSTTGLLTSVANSLVYGQTVTFNITISASSGTPTGSVNFLDGTDLLGNVALDSGHATYATSVLTAGTHSITGVYLGDTTYITSTSNILDQIVLQASTTITLSSPGNTSVHGQPVNYNISVAVVLPGAGTPTGSVNIMDGNNLLGSATLTNGQVTYTTSALTTAPHTIKAVYAGDSNFTTSNSSTLSHTVSKASTSTGLSSSSNPYAHD
jgi:hypothetical protein